MQMNEATAAPAATTQPGIFGNLIQLAQTGIQTYGAIEAAKQRQTTPYVLPYGVTSSNPYAISPNQMLPQGVTPYPSGLQSIQASLAPMLPLLLLGGGALLVVTLLMKR